MSPVKPLITPRAAPDPPWAPPVQFVAVPSSSLHGPKLLVPSASTMFNQSTNPLSSSSKMSPRSDHIMSLSAHNSPAVSHPTQKKTPQSFPRLPRPYATSTALRQPSDSILCLFPSYLVACSLFLESRKLNPPQDLCTCWPF